MQLAPPPPPKPSQQQHHKAFSQHLDPSRDEYDPAVPNEYGKAKEDQERAVLDAEMEARKAAEEREAVRSRALWLCTMHHCAPFENSVKFALPAQGRGSDTARAPWQAERT